MRTIHLYPLCWLVLLAVGLGTSLNSCTNDLPEPEQLVEPGTDADNALRPEDYVGKPVSFDGFTVTEVMTDADTRAVTRSDSKPLGEEGDVVTIRMKVQKQQGGSPLFYHADYVLSQGGTWKPQNKPLYWEGVDDDYYFTAYYPALTVKEKEEKGRTNISLLLNDWTEEDYRKHGLMQSLENQFSIGSPVSLSLQLLLTRIEVSIDLATGITDATHLTMYTRTEGTVNPDGTIIPSSGGNDVKAMNLWRDTPAGTTTGTPANPVFRGYAIPQTYAPGTLLLKHHTPGVSGALSCAVEIYQADPDGLTTKSGEVVSFKVPAIVSTKVNVHKGYKGTGSKLNSDNYEYHVK